MKRPRCGDSGGRTLAGAPCEQLVEQGRPRCCWHPLEESGVTEEQRAEQRRELATRGSVQARLNVMLSLPPETPDPVYRTPADVLAFAERTAGQVLRRELDTRLAAEAHENAALALKAMELTAWATIEALRRSVLGRRRGRP